MSEEPSALICTRLADMTVMHPKQVEKICSECGHVVGVYPTGQQMIERYPDMKIKCSVCAIIDLDGGDEVLPAGSWEEVIQEVRDSKTAGKA